MIGVGVGGGRRSEPDQGVSYSDPMRMEVSRSSEVGRGHESMRLRVPPERRACRDGDRYDEEKGGLRTKCHEIKVQ